MSKKRPDRFLKCKYHKRFQWAEPPLEPDESGRLITEYHCKNKKVSNPVLCGGDKQFCELVPVKTKKKPSLRWAGKA